MIGAWLFESPLLLILLFVHEPKHVSHEDAKELKSEAGMFRLSDAAKLFKIPTLALMAPMLLFVTGALAWSRAQGIEPALVNVGGGLGVRPDGDLADGLAGVFGVEHGLGLAPDPVAVAVELHDRHPLHRLTPALFADGRNDVVAYEVVREGATVTLHPLVA